MTCPAICKGVSANAGAGRDAAQFNVAEQANIARRIVALRVFSAVRQNFNFLFARAPRAILVARVFVLL